MTPEEREADLAELDPQNFYTYSDEDAHLDWPAPWVGRLVDQLECERREPEEASDG